ncbi:copper resistance CopC/CopD family protein [Gordonia jinhuaensis]|nr:copper resistance protein CopC [Gordonia jinhuaensis]
MASAHATLVSSSPVDGARLDESPSQIRLTFDEAVGINPSAVRVISSSGQRVDDRSPRLIDGGTTVVLGVAPNLATGSYSITWRVISGDTHLVTGSVVFGVRADAGTPVSAGSAQSTSLTRAEQVTQALLYAGLVAFFGIALICVFLWPFALSLRRIRVTMVVGWVLVVLATVAQMMLRSASADDVRSLGGVFSHLGGVTGLDSFATLLSRLVLMVLSGCGLMVGCGQVVTRLRGRDGDPARGGRDVPAHRSRAVSRVAVSLAALAVSVTVAVDGHAGVGDDAVLATVVTSLHVLAMCLWLGGLAVLAAAVVPLRRDDGLKTWSTVAFVLAVVLLLSGEYQAWRQVSPLESLWSTGYGIALLVKGALVAAMLVLAVISRRRLSTERLRRTVPLEAGLGIAVLAVTSVLVSSAPARTTYGPAVNLSAPLSDGTAEVHIGSTRRGDTDIAVAVRSADGSPATATSLAATLSSDDAGIPSLSVRFVPDGPDRWRSVGAATPLPGQWTLSLTISSTSGLAQVTSVDYRVW